MSDKMKIEMLMRQIQLMSIEIAYMQNYIAGYDTCPAIENCPNYKDHINCDKCDSNMWDCWGVYFKGLAERHLRRKESKDDTNK